MQTLETGSIRFSQIATAQSLSASTNLFQNEGCLPSRAAKSKAVSVVLKQPLSHPVEPAVLNCLGHMGDGNRFAPGEIGNGARQL